MKKTSMQIIIPADQDTVVKRVSRAVLGNTPPSKVIEPKKRKSVKHKKKEEKSWIEG